MAKKTGRKDLVVGIDLGGTNMNTGVVDVRNHIIGHDHRKTDAREGVDAVIDRICQSVHSACANAGVKMHDIAAVGIAAPGAIDIPRGMVLEAPNLRWYDVPLRDILRKKLKRPVMVDNDVNGAVWGEFQLGAGRDRLKNTSRANTLAKGGDVLGVWLGTGVGGGIVFNGRLFHGEQFTAGEVGQTILFPDGKKGRRTVEDFCSRTGMSRTIQERLTRYPKSLLREMTQGAGKTIGSKQLASAYQRKDKLAIQVVNEAAHLLGIAIANWVTVLSLEVVFIGGGVTEALGEPFLKQVRASFCMNVFPKRCQRARLIMTTLEEDAGLLGAALLAREPQH